MKILFSGYAPVHFICFKPIYEKLRNLPSVEIYLSGGTRRKTETGYLYDEKSMYNHFPDVPKKHVLSVEAIQDMEFDVLFAAHTKLIMPKRASRLIQIFHGVSFRNKAVRPENMGCDHYFIAGPYMRRKFNEAGHMLENDPRALEIGFPKTDRLLNGTLDRMDVLNKYSFSGQLPVVLYAPTGAVGNSMETMGLDVIKELAKSKQYDVMIKLHDHPKQTGTDWLNLLAKHENPHLRIANDADVIPLLHAADLLITDASSVANEFTLLDRPLVFLDTPELLIQAREANNSMLDLNTWGRKAGFIVPSARHLISTLDTAIENTEQHSGLRMSMASDFFYNPGKATDVAMQWLESNVLPKKVSRAS